LFFPETARESQAEFARHFAQVLKRNTSAQTLAHLGGGRRLIVTGDHEVHRINHAAQIAVEVLRMMNLSLAAHLTPSGGKWSELLEDKEDPARVDGFPSDRTGGSTASTIGVTSRRIPMALNAWIISRTTGQANRC
jgi:hypothetical protein